MMKNATSADARRSALNRLAGGQMNKSRKGQPLDELTKFPPEIVKRKRKEKLENQYANFMKLINGLFLL
jgi:hypothetical protein